jgi:CRP-like cAMP-binding protein
MNKVEFLRGTRLFCDLADEEIETVIFYLKVAHYDAGEYVFVEGDEADAAYIVIEGSVEITKRITAEIEKTVTVAMPGDLFGEMGMLEQEPRSASARARGPVESVWIGSELFSRLMAEHPKIGARLLGRLARVLSARLRQTTDLYADAIRWGIEVSGAGRLPFRDLIESSGSVTITLRSGKTIEGRIVRVDEKGEYDITVKARDGTLFILPFHAVDCIGVDDAAASAALAKTEVA